MVDFKETLIGKSERLNADDLIGTEKTLTITNVALSNNKNQPLVIHYEGEDGRPYYPCLSMRRVIAEIWGTDASLFTGRKLTVYRDPDVVFSGNRVGGIRIKAASHLQRAITCSTTSGRGKKITFSIQPIGDQNKTNQTGRELKPSSEEKNTEVARSMVQSVQDVTTVTALENLTKDEKFSARRDWLRKNRPQLSALLETAINDAVLRVHQSDDASSEEIPV